MPLVKDIAKERFRSAALLPDPALSFAAPYDFQKLVSFIPAEVLEVSQGSGAPLGLQDLRAGEAVLEIGCGAGINCFEAARRVGTEGKVVGVELIDDLVSIARRNGSQVTSHLGLPASAVEFKKGIAEDLPLEHEQFDSVIANYQLGTCQDKPAMLEEIYRVLRPGGRFTISDIVSDVSVPRYIKTHEERWGFCLAGALGVGEYLKIIRKAGFFGIEQLKFNVWKQIDGVHFYSVTVRGFKLGKSVPDKSAVQRYAVFRGPFAKVKDEYGNTYQRGQWKKVSKEIFEILNLPGYRPYFILSDEAVDTVTIESQLITHTSEEARETWAGDYAVLTSLFLMGEDDVHHTFYAGEPMEISEKTRDVLSNEYYSRFFTLLNRVSHKHD